MDITHELRLKCGHDSRDVDGCVACEAATLIESLRKQVEASQKREVMLRDGLKRADDLLRTSYDHVSPLIREALAATEPKP